MSVVVESGAPFSLVYLFYLTWKQVVGPCVFVSSICVVVITGAAFDRPTFSKSVDQALVHWKNNRVEFYRVSGRRIIPNNWSDEGGQQKEKSFCHVY